MQLLAATAVASAIREGWEESEAFVTDLVATKPEWDAEELKALVVGQLHQAKPLAKANFGVFNSVSFFRTGGIPRGFPPVLPLQVKKFHFLDSQSPAAIAAAEDAEKPFSHLKPIHDVAEIGFTVAMTEQARKIEKSMRDVDDELLRLTTSPKDEKDRQKNVAVKLRNLANCIRNILAGADSMLHPTARVRVGKGILKSTSASQYPHRGQSEVSITAILSEQGNEVQNPIYSQRLTLPAGINARTETLRRFLSLSRETGPLSEGESHNRVFMANVMKHIDFKTFDSVPPLSPFRIALVIAALGEAGTAHDFLTEIAMRSAPSVVIRNRATIRALCSLPGMAKAATGLSIPFDPFDRLPVFLTPAAIALSSLVTNAGTRQGDGMTTVWGAHVAPIHSISLPFTVVDGGFKAAAKPEPYDMTKVLSGTIKGVKKFNPNDWIFASTALMWDLNARLGIFGGSYDAAAAAINAVAAGAELGVLNVVWHAFIVLKQTGASSDGRIPSVPFGDSSFSATTLLSRGLSACVTQLKQPLWRLLAELLSALDSGSWDKSARLAAVEKAPHTFDAAKVLAEGTVLESVTTPQFKGGPTDLPVTLTVSRGNQHYAVVCVPTVCKSPLVMNCRDAYLAAAVHQCITTECVPFVAAAVAGAEELKPCAVEAAAALQRMATYASTTPVMAAS